MKILLPVLAWLVLAALAVWLLLIGGVVQIVHGATANPVNAMGIAIGAVRVLLTGFGIWIASAGAIILAAVLD